MLRFSDSELMKYTWRFEDDHLHFSSTKETFECRTLLIGGINLATAKFETN
jgi:hypothetical protein